MAIKRTPEHQEAYDKLSPEEKASLDSILEKANKQANIFVSIVLVGIVGGCVAIFSNIGESAKEPEEFDSIYARVYCKDQIKRRLKDPSSYKFYSARVLNTSGKYKEYGAATIDFGATNSFGGMIRQTAICDKYNENGTDYIRVNILP